MESLKIAFFCWESLYAERVGGLANAATHLAETLAKRHEVHFFTRGSGTDAEINSVQYHYCQPKGEHIIAYCSDMSRIMVDQFRQHDAPSFDLLHFHDWHVVDALHRLRHRPTVFSFHSTEFGRSGNHIGEWWEFQKISGKEWYGSFIAKRITAVSSALRDEAMRLYAIPDWKIDVVPNGVVPSEFTASVEPSAVRTAYGLNNADPLILFVGRLTYQKGPDLLLDAVPGIMDHCEGGHLVFIGDGNMRPDLESRARSLPVSFLGFLSDTAYVPLLNASDLVVIPSRNEPFGLVLLEAWSAGRCVIASDVGGLSENIDHGMDGIKVHPDPAGIAGGFAQVAGCPERITSIGRRGRTKVEHNFRWSAIAERMLDTYRKVLEETCLVS
ncbi:MAG: glycosyltransferase family 4 protein [Methanomicrobiaceae archaeon]|uniref:Glycosyltransferase subfamily 4-like N-terminal domain-containing protein n=1 Tax=hydrocarbon metagenome TaxID=938273 RepID=A0A0W8FGZ5_9ZZZZ|nr:glycosyltransferase family 4 protein [Methanomicrobiaceae archaeon]MDD5418911.1 glycosyltransferase family 4 protein [Methanomicrobiaceae archaeon]